MTKLIPLFLCLIAQPALAADSAKPNLPSAAASAPAKAPLLARFEKTCLQNSAAEGRSQKDLCTCLKNNLGAKLKPEQLSLIVRFYEGDAEAKAAVQKPENSPLLDFDMEAADHCLLDSKWQAPEGPRPPDADENAGTEIVEQEKIKETMKDKPSAEGAEALAKTKEKAAQKPAAASGQKKAKGKPKAAPKAPTAE